MKTENKWLSGRRTITEAKSYLQEMAEHKWFKYENGGDKKNHADYHSIHDVIKGLDALDLECGHAQSGCVKCATGDK